MISLTISRPNTQTDKLKRLSDCQRCAVLMSYRNDPAMIPEQRINSVFCATDPMAVKGLLSEFRYDADSSTVLVVVESAPPNGTEIDCTLYRIPSAELPAAESLTWLIENGERFADYAIRRICRSL